MRGITRLGREDRYFPNERALVQSRTPWETGIMRNAMLLQWIEQAEARRVITAALFERTPDAPWSRTAGDAAAHLLPRLGSWLAMRHPMGWVALQVQPASIRRPAGRPQSRSRDDAGYSCDW